MNTLLVLLHLAKPVAVPAYVPEVLKRWKGMAEVTVSAQECGQKNAWYTFSEKHITLCAELFSDPMITIFVLNHEMGHAFTDQNGIPDIDDEVAADELAFLMSTNEEVTGGIRFFLDLAKAHQATDPHPPSLDRAASLMCLQDARLGEGNAVCRQYYRSVQADWTRWVVAVGG